jgi:outer membrane protein TolC
MKSFLKRGALTLGALALSMTAMAEVLTLKDLRQEVLDENLDIQIQYEKYYQAQKGTSVALGEFLPKASVHLIYLNTTLAILESVVPTPSGWFNYQASQELAVAEKYATESIRLNILEGLTNNYINIKHQEMLLKSMVDEEKLLRQVYEDAKFMYEQGLGSEGATFMAKRKLLQHRQQMSLLKNLILEEKEMLLIAINRTPQEAKNLVLGELPVDDSETLPQTAEEATVVGLNNSTELVTNMYQAEAARFMTHSARWSFISFQGIGFDYPGKLAIEKSKARIIALQGEQLSLKIQNQIDTVYGEVEILEERMDLQKEVILASREIVKRNEDLYAGGQITLKVLIDSKSDLMIAERDLVTLEMEKLIKLTHKKRLLGYDSSLSRADNDAYDALALNIKQTAGRWGKTNVTINVEGPLNLMGDIFSVTYDVEGFTTSRVLNNGNFSRLYKVKGSGEREVTVIIRLLNGLTLTRTAVINL